MGSDKHSKSKSERKHKSKKEHVEEEQSPAQVEKSSKKEKSKHRSSGEVVPPKPSSGKRRHSKKDRSPVDVGDNRIELDYEKIRTTIPKDQCEIIPAEWNGNNFCQSKVVAYSIPGKDFGGFRLNYMYKGQSGLQDVILQEDEDVPDDPENPPDGFEPKHILKSFKGVEKYTPAEGRPSWNVSWQAPHPAFSYKGKSINLDRAEEVGFSKVKPVNITALMYCAWKEACVLAYEDRFHILKLADCDSVRDVEKRIKCPVYIPRFKDPKNRATFGKIDYSKSCYISSQIDCYSFKPKKKSDDEEQEETFVMKTTMYREVLDGDGLPTAEPIDPFTTMGQRLSGYPIFKIASANFGANCAMKVLLYQLDCVKTAPRADIGRPRIGRRARATYQSRPVSQAAEASDDDVEH